ncbi:IS5 family transposase [Pseudonocardia sp. DSM 110487]|nr:IS5 family transposase [Pseudonocardia sp. DSM 110487]
MGRWLCSGQLHLAVDGHGRPLSVVLTGGNVNDTMMFAQVLAGVTFRRPGPGRPATRPVRVLADKGYSSRAYLRRRKIEATLPERRDQQANRVRRGSAGGRPPVFDRVAYKRRNVVERCFNRFKQYRAIATRYDKTALSYQAMIDLATLKMWPRGRSLVVPVVSSSGSEVVPGGGVVEVEAAGEVEGVLAGAEGQPVEDLTPRSRRGWAGRSRPASRGQARHNAAGTAARSRPRWSPRRR